GTERPAVLGHAEVEGGGEEERDDQHDRDLDRAEDDHPDHARPEHARAQLALALAPALELVPPAGVLDELPLLLHAASSEMAAAPATAAVTLRVLDDIVARLLCSVLPWLGAIAAAAPAREDDPHGSPRAGRAAAGRDDARSSRPR